ncbi:hypothetical protein [Frisingicoccus sp.]|uniref:hypothetical protein n=1 Tax=Frisingicoccus sp. TaxID=1918627 RepID=UPI003995BA75
MKTEIAKDIEVAEHQIQYDTQCKKVLGNKRILSWIMRETVSEFSHMSVDDIYKCIEQEPEISTIYVDPGRTNTKDKITGINTEDKVQNEGSVTYDIRFEAYVPGEHEKIKLIINIESQKDFYPGYPIISRGIYYGARMVSAQNGVEFREPDYGDIKKVYSIWICMGAPKYIGNAVSIYEIHKTDIIGKIPDISEDYDKMCIVMICLNEKSRVKNAFFNMMNTLLSATLDVRTKKQILQDEYEIPMNDGLGKEVDLMCNLSEYVWERGIEAGIQTGIQTGREETIRTIVKKLLGIGSVSDEIIMEAAGITRDELEEIRVHM